MPLIKKQNMMFVYVPEKHCDGYTGTVPVYAVFNSSQSDAVIVSYISFFYCLSTQYYCNSH